jgi:glutathione S-transferase
VPSSNSADIELVGRSSSHFTRTARIFAEELGVPYRFKVVTDLMATAKDQYAQNPALRVPILETPAGAWFGTLNICRELARRSPENKRVVWPEALDTPLLANAQELVLQGMATEVELIMSGSPRAEPLRHLEKRRASLEGSLQWLDQHVATILAALPPRDLSFLEVTLFCFAQHLPFRQVLSIEPFPHLGAFCDTFGMRPAARATSFVFDA